MADTATRAWDSVVLLFRTVPARFQTDQNRLLATFHGRDIGRFNRTSGKSFTPDLTEYLKRKKILRVLPAGVWQFNVWNLPEKVQKTCHSMASVHFAREAEKRHKHQQQRQRRRQRKQANAVTTSPQSAHPT